MRAYPHTSLTPDLSIDNLDSTAHALLITKADYLCNALDKECDGPRWAHVKRSIEALDDLYMQIERARALMSEEG